MKYLDFFLVAIITALVTGVVGFFNSLVKKNEKLENKINDLHNDKELKCQYFQSEIKNINEDIEMSAERIDDLQRDLKNLMEWAIRKGFGARISQVRRHNLELEEMD